MKKIIIIGGGIAGLAAAYRVQECISGDSPVECVLLEGDNHFGGKIRTDRVDQFVIEKGPDSFISQKPAAIQLCRKLGIGDHLIGTNREQTNTYVYTGKKMVRMPDGLSLMIPTKFLPFALSPLFSWPGKIRMGMDLFIPKKSDDGDESLASFVRRRLGEEALEKMAEPMLAGIYASDPERMSIGSTFPMFTMAEKKYRSLILGMLARKRQAGNNSAGGKSSPYTLFMTLKDGLGEMVDAIIRQSPNIEFRSRTKVNKLQRKDARPDGWNVTLDSGEEMEADAVILATPAKISARLVEAFAPELAGLLDRITYVSTATVTMAYHKKGFSHPLNGFGFVIPRTEQRKILACTWTSTKFPHRAPDGYVMLRCFVGGASREELAEQEPEEISAMVEHELLEIMGIREKPAFSRVYHNHKANVQYHVNHAGLIQSVNDRLRSTPGLYLAGSAYNGIGIPDCIVNGTSVAEAALDFLREKREESASG